MNNNLDARLLELGKTILANLEVMWWEKINELTIEKCRAILEKTIYVFLNESKDIDIRFAPLFDIKIDDVYNCIVLTPKNNLARRIEMLLYGGEEIQLDDSNKKGDWE